MACEMGLVRLLGWLVMWIWSWFVREEENIETSKEKKSNALFAYYLVTENLRPLRELAKFMGMVEN